MKTHPSPLSLAAAGSIIVAAMAPFSDNDGMVPFSSRASAQTPQGTIAAQIREQGYRCYKPLSARRDAKLSKPDEAVWVLKCSNAVYRVRLDPDMAAHVTKLK